MSWSELELSTIVVFFVWTVALERRGYPPAPLAGGPLERAVGRHSSLPATLDNIMLERSPLAWQFARTRR